MKISYIRTSTSEQNPKNQLKDIKSMFEGEHEVYEEKQSAWKDNKERLVFDSIKDLIKQKKVNDLYVWDLDRIYRNRLKIVEFLKFCKIYDCNVHSFRQQWLEEIYKIPNPWNEIVSDMLINVMGWMAEEESNKKSERVKSAIKKRDGQTFSKFGNKWGRKSLSKKVIGDVKDLHKKGLSIREIADSIFYWDKHNNKKKVSKSAVHKILSGGIVVEA